MVDSAALLLSDAAAPHSLALSILGHQQMARKKGDRMDLAVALLTALSQSPAASSSLSPAISTNALDLLRTLSPSPRAFALFLTVFRIHLPRPQPGDT